MLAELGPIVLAANGLAAGVLLSTQLGGWPLLKSLPADRYVQTHAFFSTRYDPLMPICLVATVLGDLLLGLFTDRAAVVSLLWLAGALALAAAVISVTKNVPVNKWIRTIDPDNLPADFADRDPRLQWGAWNRRRSVLGVLAFLVNCAAVGLAL